VLGFAHRDGALRRIPLPALVGLAGGAMLLGAAYGLVHPDEDAGYDLNEIPLAQSLWSLGAVLLLLRPSPSMAWLDRTPLLGRLVTLLNARAVTVYLWHEIALVLAVPIDDRLGLESTAALFGTAWVLIGAAILLVGPVEDLAAGRRPRLLPWSRGDLVRARDRRSAAVDVLLPRGGLRQGEQPEPDGHQQEAGRGDHQQRAEPADAQAGDQPAVLGGGRTRVADHDDRAADLS
jgi:hypothetical protein